MQRTKAVSVRYCEKKKKEKESRTKKEGKRREENRKKQGKEAKTSVAIVFFRQNQ
jgi:hypothetical protein